MKRIAAAVLAVIMLASLSGCVSTDNDLDRYGADVVRYGAMSFMPTLESLGQYSDVQYFVRMDEGVFPAYSLRLIASYEEAEFKAEVKRLETAYTYLQEPQTADYSAGAYYTMPLATFSAAGFDFRVAQLENTVYPKNFGMVGVSREMRQVAYLWYYCPDHDFICEAGEDRSAQMEEFLNHHFEMDKVG